MDFSSAKWYRKPMESSALQAASLKAFKTAETTSFLQLKL